MNYGWRSFSFDLPDGLEDESVLTFIGRDGEEVDMNVTFTRDALGGGFDDYLASAVDDLRKSLSAYKLVGQQDTKVGGRAAKLLEHSATSPDGRTLCQMQAYIEDDKDVVIVTATGREEAKSRLQKTFDKIIESFRAG
jgi:hypothetical protein